MSRRLVVIGDVLLDVDVLTRAERLTPDAPVPVLDELERQLRPGGAALAALLAARDPDTDVTLIAPLPEDEAAREIRARLAGAVELIALPAVGATPVKTRLRANAHTVARLDSGGGVGIAATGTTASGSAASGSAATRTAATGSTATWSGVSAEVAAQLGRADAVLVSDYGGAAARDERLRQLLSRCAAPIVWDPHPRGAAPVPGVAMATPNLGEALGLSGAAAQPADRTPLSAARRAGEALRTSWGARSVCVTLGARGAILTFGPGTSHYLPVATAATGDPCGAGDCFAGAAALALAHGDLPSQAAARAVRAAAAFITGGGVGSLRPAAERPSAAGSRIEQVRAAGGTIVATGGCFDLLHAGHIQTLAAARSAGDCLVVLINSDDSIRRIKGEGRPLQQQADRARVLAALRDVDEVIVFSEDTPERALAQLRPDVWVKGGDYAGEELPEAELIRSWGGEVLTVGYLDGKSTSTLVELARR